MCIGQHVPTNAESLFVWKARLLWGKGAPFSLAPFFNCLILSTNFGQPKTWPVCRFRYCFLDICSYKNHSAETWGLGCLFLDYRQPGYLCGLQPIDHPLRPGSHQWTHSTALSLFRWPEQLILSKWIGECSSLKATQCWHIRQTGHVFSTQNRYAKWDIR